MTILVFLKLGLVMPSSITFLLVRVEGVAYLRFYLRLGVSSFLFFMGGKRVPVLECD